MASRLRGMNGMPQYIVYLKSEGKTGASHGTRVQYEYSTLCAGTEDIDGMVAELKLSAGHRYEAYDFRIGFGPDDRKLTEQEFRNFIDQVTAKALPKRNLYGIYHCDTSNPHIQMVACFLDSDGRIINNKGKGKYAACIRLQDAVDETRRAFGLSVISREPGTYNSSKSKVPLGVVRAAESGKYIWTSDLKLRIKAAKKVSTSVPSFLKNLEKQGVHARLRGQGISYDFMDQNGKKRVSRGRKLGKFFELSSIEQSFIQKQERTERQAVHEQRQVAQAVSQGIRAVADLQEGKVTRVFITLFGLLAIAMERAERQGSGAGIPSINNHKEEVVKMDEKEKEMEKLRVEIYRELKSHDRHWKAADAVASNYARVGCKLLLEGNSDTARELAELYHETDKITIALMNDDENELAAINAAGMRYEERKAARAAEKLIPGAGLSMSHGKQEAGKIVPSGLGTTTANTNPGDKPGK